MSRDELDDGLLDKVMERAFSERRRVKGKHASFAIREVRDEGSQTTSLRILTKVGREVFIDETPLQDSPSADILGEELERAMARAPAGAECTGLTSESSVPMHRLWRALKAKHARMFCQGDPSLGLRLVIKEVRERIGWLKPLAASANEMVAKLLRHHRSIGELVEGSCSGIWSRISDSLDIISPDESLLDSEGKAQRPKELTAADMKRALVVLEPLVDALSHLESQASAISDVYHLYHSLPKSVDAMDDCISHQEKAIIKECINKQWAELYSDAYGVSYLLDPRYLGDGMDEDTSWKISDFISYKFPYHCSSTERCASAELTDFLNTYRDAREENPHRLDQFAKAHPKDRFPQTTVYEFWKGMSGQRWNHLREIALVVFSLCTTSEIHDDAPIFNLGNGSETEPKLRYCQYNLRQLAQKRKREGLQEES